MTRNGDLIQTEEELLAFLDRSEIQFQRITHAPVYTCDQAEQYRPDLPAVSTKNLFLRDKRRNFFLVMTACRKRVDLKALGRALMTNKLHFGSPEDLLEMLGVTPGAVTVLGLINDRQQRLRLVVDADIAGEENFLCHPLVNTATLVLTRADLLRFFEICGHQPEIVSVPEAQDKH
jgi:Ala-tRNA(Pro) deacylase